MSQTARIVLDRALCTGHGRCADLVPELFDLDDEGHSIVVRAEVQDRLVERARLAVDNCPERAIELVPIDTRTTEPT
jgi:ferredoxin